MNDLVSTFTTSNKTKPYEPVDLTAGELARKFAGSADGLQVNRDLQLQVAVQGPETGLN